MREICSGFLLRSWAGLLSILLVGAAAAPLAGESLGSRQSAQLTVLHLADVYEMVPVDGGKFGGLARVAALERQLAAERSHVLMTIGGDFLSPSVASSVFRGEQMVSSLGATGLDLATLGNHEFDFGPEVLLQRMRESSFDWVVSNVLDAATGEPFGGAAPWLVRQYGDLKVGFLGLCIIGEEITAKNREGVEFLDPFEVTERYLPVLEKEGAEVIIALTHLDFVDDVRLARRFPRIDLILGGHEHFPITTYVERTLITKPGSDARNVARIDISRPQPDAPVEKHFEMVPIVEGMVEDSTTSGAVAAWEARLDEELAVTVGATREPLNAVAEDVRSGESNLGNVFADAMRRDTGAQVAILNSGSIRSNRIYPPGDLTRRDLIAMHPFGGIACAVEVSGATLAAAIENGFSRLGESSGRFPQISGLRVRIDSERPAGGRLVEATIDGQPLDPQGTYTVAITDYMLEGGDGYSMFESAKVLVSPEAGGLLVNLLEQTVRENQPLAPQMEGRISFLGEPPPARTARRRSVLLDTDMGIDSVMGLLYLLKAPEVSLEAITIVHGVADIKPGARNAMRILELTGDSDIPVAFGSRRPLQGQRRFPSVWKPRANTLGNAALPPATARPHKGAVDLMISTLVASPEPMTIIAMGPLTNVALALAKEPSIADKIAEIAVMGGAIEVPGNVGNPYMGIDNNAAEWNFYLDPHAAQQVLASGVRIRLMPLDATRALPVTSEFVDRVRTRPRDQTSDLLLSLLESVHDGIEAEWYYFWDVLAAVATAHPEVLACRDETIQVVTREGPMLGRTQVAASGSPVCVVEQINRQAFEEDLLQAILD
jgi:5'-nucleotidase